MSDLSDRGRSEAAARAAAADAKVVARAREDFGAAPAGVVVAALGGYGARELAPGSDLDLLLFVEDPKGNSERIEGFVAGAWDLGHPVGHVVRTARDLRAVAGKHIESRTSLFGLRVLFGDAALARDLARTAEEILTAHPAAFVRKILAARAARIARAGETTGLAEPHLQDAAGGLRDAQAADWIGRILPRARGAAAALEEVKGVLLAFRSALHEVGGRNEERLALDHQEDVAARLGLADPTTAMRILLGAMRETERILLARAAPPGRARRAAGRPTLARLLAGPRAASLLAEAAGDGSLAAALPVWRHLEGLVRPDPVHRYSVDRHTLAAVAQYDALCRAKGSRWFRAALEERGDDALARAALLLHDSAKGRGGGHETRGADEAPAHLAPLGLDETEIDFVRFLIREHLLLPRSAFRRDIDDPALLSDVAARVGSLERLASLYLLTLSDLSATRPDALDAWKEKLLETLYVRLRRQILRALPPREIAEAARARRAAALRRLSPRVAEDEVRAHLAAMPDRYAMAFPAPSIHRHLRLLRDLPRGAYRAERWRGARADTTEVTILGPTQRGLAARLAGVFAARGLSILEAEFLTRADGVILDVLRADDPDGRLLGERDWEALRGLLERAVFGEEPIEPHIERIARYHPAEEGPVEIEWIPNASPTASVLEVRAPDRTGLLYEIIREIHRCGVGLESAIVGTEENTAIDIFYLTDSDTGRPLSSETQSRLRRAIRGSL